MAVTDTSEDFTRLLAKSFYQDATAQTKGAATYTGHISFVIDAANLLVEQIGGRILQQLCIQQFSSEEFVQTVKLGAYLHDWGKANHHFQMMVYGKSFGKASTHPQTPKVQSALRQLGHWDVHQGQMVRHEIISGILALQVPSFRSWLEQCPQIDEFKLVAAVWAAIGHHLKTRVGQDGNLEIQDGTGSKLKIYTHHSDFQAILKLGHQRLGLPADLPCPPPNITWAKEDLQKSINALITEFGKFEDGLDWEQRKFVAAVKATVMAADLAGSALPVEGEDLQSWMQAVLGLVLSADELQALIDQRLRGKTLRAFQQEVANTPHRVTLVKAGCGTGKTIAAYAWAQRWAQGRKLFFCYPTTGTASQGFIDYAEGTDIEAALMHSRADLDRELLFSGEPDDSEGLDARLIAFQAWRKKLIICTVDTVLGLIQNNRRSLYAWPAIAQAAFVFDEVHSYDEALFGAFLQFLKAFKGAPTLIMSASFTPSQLEAIHKVMDELGESLAVEPIPGDPTLEALKRYEVQAVESVSDDLSEVWEPVLQALRQGQKVLWVTNSVQDKTTQRGCIEIYRLAQQVIQRKLPNLDLHLLIYHSRFRYRDRLKKHDAVIQAFKGDRPVLAITTQVCEMSLDISADLLVTAMAPAAAIIQRMGRLNRRMTCDTEGTRLAIVYPWKNPRPYDNWELATGEKLIARLQAIPKISQWDLAEIAASLETQESQPISSAWLEHQQYTFPMPLRGAGYTLTVLLQADMAAIRQQADLRKQKSQDLNRSFFMQEAQAWAVPIRLPPISKLREWQRCRFYPIAPPEEVAYSEEVGAEQ